LQKAVGKNCKKEYTVSGSTVRKGTMNTLKLQDANRWNIAGQS
jgi:hypothetical protein